MRLLIYIQLTVAFILPERIIKYASILEAVACVICIVIDNDTIINHLRNTKTNLNDYSIIITGDLSKVGSKVLEELFLQSDNPFKNHLDAGCMIYDEKTQEDVYAGGSGCACLPLVGYTLILNRLIDKTYSRVLFVGTGCLHSKESNAKKQTIPVIAHAVEFRRV